MNVTLYGLTMAGIGVAMATGTSPLMMAALSIGAVGATYHVVDSLIRERETWRQAGKLEGLGARVKEISETRLRRIEDAEKKTTPAVRPVTEFNDLTVRDGSEIRIEGVLPETMP